MKKLNFKTVALLATLLVSFSFFSCVNQIQDDSGTDADEKVTVNISFSGFNFSYDEDDVTTRADQTAADVQVNRIALAVLDKTYQNKVEFLRSNSETGTFQNMALNVHCFLKENPQSITVTVVMKDASGNEVESYTFNNASMAPHRTTRATGKFFHASAGGSFTFDNSDDTTVDVPF